MQGSNNKLRAAIVAVGVSLLTACGGGGSGSSGAPNPPGGIDLQVVSFGDSLSDVGTYAPIAGAVGGGRFTTNPGQVWTQDVAQYYGGTLTAAFTIDPTHELQAQGGLGYAEGGATVATPVNQQVSSYITAQGSFNANQLVLVWAGANDVLRAGTPPAATTTVQTAATTLAQLVGQIVQNGATHVVVVNLPNIGLSPEGLASSDGGANFTQMSELFNSTLTSALQTNGLQSKVIQVDAYTWLNGIIANFQANGFSVSNTGQACDPKKTPDDTSLLCSPATYVSANADQTYMFADDLRERPGSLSRAGRHPRSPLRRNRCTGCARECLFKGGSRTEELIMALGFRYSNRLQMFLDRLHESNGAEKVGVHVTRFRQPFSEPCLIEVADTLYFVIFCALLLVAVETLELRVTRGEFIERTAKRMHAAVPGGVDEMHGARGFERGLQHRERGGDADAAADQHKRLVAAFELEVAGRCQQFERVAFVDVGVQMVRNLAVGVALDADAVFLAVGRRRQRIVSTDVFPIDDEAHANVLARFERQHCAAIVGTQVERRDLIALAHFARDPEQTQAAPSTGRRFPLGIHLLFESDQQVGELLVCGGPCFDDRIRGDLRAEHFTDRSEQTLANDRIMLGQDVQCHVLVDDLADEAAKLFELIDVTGVHQHAVGQRALLRAARLIRLIEVRPDFRMFLHQQGVEVLDQRFTAGFEERDGCFNDGAMFGGEHGVDSLLGES
jgi:phospholipase/lecithinase/hemolysin